MGLQIFNSIVLHNKIINKMRKAKIKKIQENSANRFGEYVLTNHFYL